MVESQKRYAQRKKADVKDYISSDYIYVKCSEKANLERQKAGLWLRGGKGGVTVNGIRDLGWGQWKDPKIGLWGWLHSSVNLLKIAEVYT